MSCFNRSLAFLTLKRFLFQPKNYLVCSLLILTKKRGLDILELKNFIPLAQNRVKRNEKLQIHGWWIRFSSINLYTKSILVVRHYVLKLEKHTQ